MLIKIDLTKTNKTKNKIERAAKILKLKKPLIFVNDLTSTLNDSKNDDP